MRGDSARPCIGCGSRIHDQYILRVAPNLEWHAACLKCSECKKFLDENCTCFVRNGKIFCKEDYLRLFGTKCEKCQGSFGKNDFVMRAKNKIFHLECFRCVACTKQLVPGDEFALRSDGLYCKEDHQFSIAAADEVVIKKEENNNDQTPRNDDDDFGDDDIDFEDDVDSRMSEHGMEDMRGSKSQSKHSSSGSETSCSSHNNQQQPQQHQQQRRSRAGRVRTVLTEKQLQLLKSCYMANPRPDALMKEQLVEMTGLSPRVIRVWFQNKRCKDKKKMQLKQNKEVKKMGYSAMHGVPMMASSPMRHDMAGGSRPLDVHSYEPPWKALCDFALHSDLDRLNPNGPHYQNIVNQMHGNYDYHRPPPTDPSMMYPHSMEQECPPPHLNNELDPALMSGLVRSPLEDDHLLGDLDSSSYSLTSLDTIARSMDRGRPTQV